MDTDIVDCYTQWLSDKVDHFGYSDYNDSNSSADTSESIESLMEKRNCVFKLHRSLGGNEELFLMFLSKYVR